MKKSFSFLIFFVFLVIFTAFPAFGREYTLKGGSVFLDGAEIPEVDIIPLDGPTVRFWTILGPDGSDGLVSEEETGVHFFNEEGVKVAFLPLDSEYECPEIAFNPDEEYFFIGRGGMRLDLVHEVYRFPSMELVVDDLSGFRGSPGWIDQYRFALTKIDDIREEGRLPGRSYGFRLSAILYDAAMKEEFLLFEATETQNFYVTEVDREEGLLTITEESVNKPEDWADVEKYETREFTVEFPAAG